MSRISYSCVTLLVAISLFFTAASASAAEPVSKSRFSRVAIAGHDTVEYHRIETDPQAKAVQGSKSYTVEYKGAYWRFASKESSELFAANPEKYTPRYNGHCANALSLGNGLLRTDGTHWEIFGDNLYLFYAAKGRIRWTQGDWESYKAEADAAWERILSK